MINRIKYFILFLLIFVSTEELFCQKDLASTRTYVRGFIITSTGDTVEGFIGNQFKNTLRSVCIFKPGIRDKATTLGPSAIAGFGSYVNNQMYISTPVLTGSGENLLFVRELLDGTYDLLYYEFLGLKHFLVRKPLAKIFDITYPPELTESDYLNGISRNEKFSEEISSVFLSSPEMLEYAKNVKPEVGSMVNYFKKYHEISGYPFKIYRGRQNSLRVGLIIGVTFDRYVANPAYKKIQSSTKPASYAGIYANLINNNTGSGLFLQTAVSYKSHHYSYSVEKSLSKNYYETFMTSFVSVSRLGFTINPPTITSFKPFIEGGALVNIYLNPKYDNYRDEFLTVENTIFTYHNNSILNSLFYYGGFLRAGIQLNLKSNNLLRFSGGYDFLLSSGTERIHSIDISVTYMMKFK
jgi:hypothetical protein